MYNIEIIFLCIGVLLLIIGYSINMMEIYLTGWSICGLIIIKKLSEVGNNKKLGKGDDFSHKPWWKKITNPFIHTSEFVSPLRDTSNIDHNKETYAEKPTGLKVQPQSESSRALWDQFNKYQKIQEEKDIEFYKPKQQNLQ